MHSFVRGNWRNDKEVAFMLLAKSCYDIDWIFYVMGTPINYVQPFDSLSYFNKENAPAGNAKRGFDCTVHFQCLYDAVQKNYVDDGGWTGDTFNKIVSIDHSEAALEHILRNGPYGRCVYHYDNNVVDHQIVNFEFLSGETASLTMTAFTEMADRKARIFESHGRIEGVANQLKFMILRRIDPC